MRNFILNKDEVTFLQCESIVVKREHQLWSMLGLIYLNAYKAGLLQVAWE